MEVEGEIELSKAMTQLDQWYLHCAKNADNSVDVHQRLSIFYSWFIFWCLTTKLIVNINIQKFNIKTEGDILNILGNNSQYSINRKLYMNITDTNILISSITNLGGSLRLMSEQYLTSNEDSDIYSTFNDIFILSEPIELNLKIGNKISERIWINDKYILKNDNILFSPIKVTILIQFQVFENNEVERILNHLQDMHGSKIGRNNIYFELLTNELTIDKSYKRSGYLSVIFPSIIHGSNNINITQLMVGLTI